LDKCKVVAVIDVSSDPQSALADADPQSVAASRNHIWVTDRSGKAVSRIDPETNRIVERIPVGFAVYDIAIDGDALWLTNTERGFVARVDTTENRMVKVIDLDSAAGIIVASGSVWVAEMGPMMGTGSSSKVVRVDPRTNEVVKEIPLERSHPQSIAFGAGSLWIANGEGSCTVSRVDPETNEEVARIGTGLSVFDVAVGGGSVWAAGAAYESTGCEESYREALARIDPANNEVVGRTNIRNANGVAATADAVWIFSAFDSGAGLLRGKATGVVTRVEPTR
jgi:DNA-binding beta-propeller fold protein YncE